MQVASDPVDVQDLQFKLQCRLKVFDKTEGQPLTNSSNLIASASYFGLVFVGCSTPKLKVLRFASIEDYSCSSEPIDNYSRREVVLPSVPSYISVNCNHTKLAVIVEKDSCPVILFYDVLSFLKQNITLLNEVRASSTPGVKVIDANWHPTIDLIFTECKTDGSLGIYELNGTSVDIKKLPTESGASCFCWSPKGKQIAVGSRNGKLTHYKPDLKAVKVISAPPFQQPYVIISLQWISNYQFIGVFKPQDNSDDQCNLVIIDAPKTGEPTFTNFFDVCYSNGRFRSPQFYMLFEQHWNILMVASANGMEVGVLAVANDKWTQCILQDSARAELPLDENRDETYPIGMAIDTSSVKPVPWGESSLQPVPSLLLLSNQGILCCFKIINLKNGVPSINSPVQTISDLSGLGTFTTGSTVISKSAIEITKTAPQVTQPSLLQQVQQKAIKQQFQMQKEVKPEISFNTPLVESTQKTGPLQFSFQSPQTTIQPIPKTVQPQLPSSTPSTNLFGSEVTITPNNKDTSFNPSALLGSMLLNAGNPSSPGNIVKGNTTIAPKPAQQFSAIGQTPINSKINSNQSDIVVPVPINQNLAKPQPQMTAPSIPTSIQSEKPQELEENNGDIENILQEMIQMEFSAIGKKVEYTLLQGKEVKIDLDNKDSEKIIKSLKDIKDFIKELIETSESQTSEIHMLKQASIQPWAWLEEVRTSLKQYQDEELRAVLKLKPLDSVSEKHLHSIKQMEYYLDSQITQANNALDHQWDQFQEHCRKIHRVQTPTMEVIFQTMVKQNAILQKQEYLMKDISSQVKGKKKGSDNIHLFNSLNKNLSLEDSFKNMQLEPDDLYQIYQQKLENRVKSVTANRAERLRDALRNREIPHLKCQSINPFSQIVTPEKKDRFSLVNMTPTTKHSEVQRNLNFFQSTPVAKSEYNFTAQIPSSPASAFVPPVAAGKLQGTSSVSKLAVEVSKSATTDMSQPQNASKSIFSLSTLKNEDSKINYGSTQSTFGEQKPLFGNTLQTNQTQNIFAPAKPSVQDLSQKPTTASTASVMPSNIFSSGLAKSNSTTSVFFSTTTTSVSAGSANTLFSNLTSQPTNSAIAQSSLFSPITSTLPTTCISNTSLSNVVNFSSTKNSVFVPITSISTSASVLKPIESVSSPSFFGKTSEITVSKVVSINASQSTTSISKPSTLVNTSKTSIFGNANTISLNQPGTLFKTPPNVSSGFSLPGQVTSIQSSLFSGSTAFTPIASTSQDAAKPTQSIFATSIANSNIPNITPVASMATSVTASVSDSAVTTTVSTSTPLITKSSLPSVSTASGSIFGAASLPKSSGILLGTTPTSTVSGSVFGTASSTNIFGSAVVSTVAENIFGTSSSSTVISKSQPSIVTGSNVPSGSVSSVSGSIINVKPISTTGNLFGAKQTTSSENIFGKTPVTIATSNVFGTVPVTTVSGSILGTTTTSSSTNTGSVFATTSSSTNTGSVFATTSVSTNTGNVFGTTPVSTNTSNVFGTTSVSTNTGSVFGTTSVSTVGTGSLFGGTAVSSSAPISGGSNSIFGSAQVSSSKTTNSGSIFGSSTTTTSGNSVPLFGATAPDASKSIFGTAAASNPTVFGAATSSSPFAASSTFGANTPVTNASVFGNAGASSSPFGSANTSTFGAVSSTSSSFGVTSSTTEPAFGSSAPFGTPTTTTITSSPFGGSPFGGTAFGSNVTSANSPFGTTATSSVSPFASNFGATSTSSASPFSSNSQPSSVFGKPSTFGQNSGFGGSNFGNNTTTSAFGQTNSNSPSIFGNPTTTNVFGGTTTSPGFGTAASPFGNTATVGSTSPFGQSGQSEGLFGQPQKMFGSSNNTENTGGAFGFGSLNVGSATQSPFAKTTETKSPFGGSTFNTTSSSGSLFGSSNFGNNSGGGSLFGQSSFGNSFGNTQQTPGPFSGSSGSVVQSGFGTSPGFQKPSGFGGQPSFGGSPAFGASPAFGGAATFGASSFGSPNKVFGNTTTGAGTFGSNNTQQQNAGFGNLSSQNTVGFGNLAQQAANNGNTPFSGTSSFSNWR